MAQPSLPDGAPTPVAALRRMAFLLERAREDTYKVKAYRNAAAAMAQPNSASPTAPPPVLTSTSPAPGTGRGTSASATTSLPPYALMTTAFMSSARD